MHLTKMTMGEEDEIEITPEMIEAGANELAAHELNFSNGAEVIAAVYAAMVRAYRSTKKPPVKGSVSEIVDAAYKRACERAAHVANRTCPDDKGCPPKIEHVLADLVFEITADRRYAPNARGPGGGC